MAQKNINSNMLTPNNTFVMRGRVQFAAISHIIQGDELEASIRRDRQFGRIPTDKPHTKITLEDVTIIPKSGDINNLTLEEQYAMERMYISNKGKRCYTAIRKGNTVPKVGVVDPSNPSIINEIFLDPRKNLATGLDVTLYFRVYATSMNNGISLDTVVLNEPLRYFESSNISSTMNAQGLTWNSAPDSARPQVDMNPAANQTAIASNPAQDYGVPQTASYPQANVNSQSAFVANTQNPMPAPTVKGAVPQTVDIPPVQAQSAFANVPGMNAQQAAPQASAYQVAPPAPTAPVPSAFNPATAFPGN